MLYPPLCTAVSSSGFWQGLWDGFTAPFTLIASIFFDVSFYDVCARSWWYNCMFLCGMGIASLFSLTNPVVAFWVFCACFVVYVVWLIFANILYIAIAAAVCVVIIWLANNGVPRFGR